MVSKRAGLGLAAAAAYVAVVVAANVLSSEFGMVGIGFGLVASAGTYAAGAALGLRDAVQEGLGKRGSLAVIVVGSALSFVLADPAIALASLLAFTAGELLDLGVYSPLRRRGWARAVVASNVVGAVVDTVVFLYVSGFGLTYSNIVGQLVGKILWATLVPVALICAAREAYRRVEA